MEAGNLGKRCLVTRLIVQARNIWAGLWAQLLVVVHWPSFEKPIKDSET